MRSSSSTPSAGAASTARGGGGPDRLDCEFAVLVAELEIEPLDSVQTRLARWRARLDGVEARRCAAQIGADGDLSAAKRAAATRGKRSKQAADRAAKRAGAVAANPGLGDKMESGDLTAEQVDTIAQAMDTGPSAATDADLIDQVASASVDQGRRIGREWATERTTADKTQTEHDRQRALRQASRYTNRETGCGVIRLEGEQATIESIWKQVTSLERSLWRSDGGRELRPDQHPRTTRQRLFDALVQLITTNPGATGVAGGRPAVVFGLDLENLNTGRPVAGIVGHGPVADSVVIDALAQGATVFANVAVRGKTLWWGRARRSADVNQYLALAVRDKGCVLCGVDPHLCDAHHLLPWTSPAAGTTDLDNLALLCPSCHANLHAINHTLYRTSGGMWQTRPATAAETPAPRPTASRKSSSARHTKPVATPPRSHPRHRRHSPTYPPRSATSSDQGADPA